MDFNHYFTNDEIASLLAEWANTFANLLTVKALGQSYEGRPIWLLTLTNQATGADSDKPAVWIDANIHATEITGTTTALLIAYTLLSGYGHDEQATHLLDHCTYYIVPRLNPDGAALAMATPPQYIRSGVRLYPYTDKDDGLHPEDIDGDGRVLQMRIKDPNGDWKISSLDPRLMEKRSPAERGGIYYRLLPEGTIKDFDGYIIRLARPPQSLDFNRNFPFEWRPEGEQSGAGPYPTSEPEIRALVDFITCHPNINAAVTFHTFGRVILRPYSTKPDEQMETGDLWVYKKLAELGTQLTGYRAASVFHDFRYHPKEITTGAFDDWLFDHLGMFTFTIEQWDLPTEAGIKERKFIDWFREHPHEQDLQILQWADQNVGAGACVGWYPYEHPQLGQVELGGWDGMYTWRNPPTHLVGAEAARHVPYLLALGDMLPQLSIYNLKVTPLGGEDYHINLVLENSGFFPTYTSQQGKKRKAIRPLRIELDAPSTVKVINGKRRVELDHLEGRSNKLEVTSIWDATSTDHRTRVEWVLHGPAGTQIEINGLSERAGRLHLEVKLP